MSIAADFAVINSLIARVLFDYDDRHRSEYARPQNRYDVIHGGRGEQHKSHVVAQKHKLPKSPVPGFLPITELKKERR